MIIFNGLIEVIKEVFLALIPLVTVFLSFNFLSLKLERKELLKMLWGLFLTFVGLAFFIQGVNISFIAMGESIGKSIGAYQYNWVLIPIGFILGFVVTFAEPAIKILNIQVEKVSGGYINKKIMLYFLSFGVALSVSLSMIRVLLGISLWYFILPGYILAFILTKYVSPIFISIAFDSGGVVTGPMIATFLLAFTVGISYTVEGSNPLVDGFGTIAMVSLVPILSVLILGILYNRSITKGGK